MHNYSRVGKKLVIYEVSYVNCVNHSSIYSLTLKKSHKNKGDKKQMKTVSCEEIYS